MKSKFKVGDKVRILKDNFGYKKGDEGVIVRCEYGGWIVYVERKKSSSRFDPNVWVADCDLELIASDKIEVSKTFLLEGYDAACSQWKKIIKKEAPELFEDEVRLEVGKWYKFKEGYDVRSYSNFMFLYSGEEGDCAASGFNTKGDWCENTLGVNYQNSYREATREEVKSALVKEAKKRGYKVGVKIKPIGKYPITTIGRLDFSYWEIDNEITLHVVALENEWEDSCSNPQIFKDGKWAEIIKEQKVELTLQEIADKFGVSVESLRVKE